MIEHGRVDNADFAVSTLLRNTVLLGASLGMFGEVLDKELVIAAERTLIEIKLVWLPA